MHHFPHKQLFRTVPVRGRSPIPRPHPQPAFQPSDRGDATGSAQR